MTYSPQEHNRAMDRLLAAMDALPVRKCIQCGGPTTGSVWSDKQVCRSLCQSCKDAADAQARRTLESTVRMWDRVLPRATVRRTRECPICNGVMTFSPAEEEFGAHTGFRRLVMPAVWACENCEHEERDHE